MRIIAKTSGSSVLVECSYDELNSMTGNRDYLSVSEQDKRFPIGATLAPGHLYSNLAHVCEMPSSVIKISELLRAEADKIDKLNERLKSVLTPPAKPARVERE